MVTSLERDYLRNLAKQVNLISQDPIWAEKSELWKKKNSLIKTRPLVLCTLPEEVWPELVDPKSLRINDPFLRKYEWYLKKQIYRSENLKDDEIISNIIYSPLEYRFSDWVDNRIRPYSGDGQRAEAFHPCIIEYDDLKKLKKPSLLNVNVNKEQGQFELLNEIFGNILDVRLGQPYSSDTDSSIVGWGVSAIDILCELRGLENIYYDMALAPEFVHEAMFFLTQGISDYMDTMEREGLLRLNNNAYISSANTPAGSNGLTITDELPVKDYHVENVRFCDLWGYAMAQELAPVSPEMHMEYVLKYQQPLCDRFGLLTYGCCEPNDQKWENIFKTFSNLRILSVSHAADLDIAAEKIKDKYVFSWKPSCSTIATFDENEIREQLTDGLIKIKGCHSIICLRDNLTAYGFPHRFNRWVEIANEVARNEQ